MDHPTIGPGAPVRLRRACDRTRLARQFLIDAYERLVPFRPPKDPRRGTDEGWCDGSADRTATNHARLVGATAVWDKLQG
jgi:hypothetical protein